MQAYPYCATVVAAVAPTVRVLYLGKSVQTLAGADPVQEAGIAETAALTEEMKARAEILENICLVLVKNNK